MVPDLTATTDGTGQFAFDNVAIGIYRLVIEKDGFNAAARNLTLVEPGEKLVSNFDLVPGAISEAVSITATRGERDASEVPAKAETVASEQLIRQNPTTTQDALTNVAN